MSPADRSRGALAHQDAEARLAEAFVLLDDSSGRGPSFLFTEPVAIVSALAPAEVAAGLARLRSGLESGLHAAGFFAYELGYVLEPRLGSLLPEGRDVPLFWFGLYREPAALTSEEVDQWLARQLRGGAYAFTDVTLDWDEATYRARFESVQECIRAGDIYQLNLTFKARFRLSGPPLAFYRDLRQRQRVAYAGIVDTGAVTVLSASPELFIERRGAIVATRPMKGTAPRAGLPDADRAAARALAADPKQRAENLMIVDLMRNDLGRIAEVGTVSVTDLFTVETYRTLHQMTSGVRATLRPDIGIERLLAAMFPPGSVTGAPKIRAMELIRKLEMEPRGVYCGAVGSMSPAGDATFNVAIRTPVVFRDGHGEMGIGSGVVYDSQGTREYAECLLKMKFLTDPPQPFELIETLLFEPGSGLWLLERHLERLAASARYFAFPFAEPHIRRALEQAVANGSERLRVRLLLAEDGRVSVTTSPQPQPPGAIMRYVISETRTASADPFLFHKTTRRELYDRDHRHHAGMVGADEVLYLNERGELTEGSRTSIFIERNDRLETPPLSAGLLPGTLRAELIASGRAVEATLRRQDLDTGDTVYLGNSVQGLLRARSCQPVSDGEASRETTSPRPD